MNEERTLEVEIEPGVRDGMEYPFIGEGEMLVLTIRAHFCLIHNLTATWYVGGVKALPSQTDMTETSPEAVDLKVTRSDTKYTFSLCNFCSSLDCPDQVSRMWMGNPETYGSESKLSSKCQRGEDSQRLQW